MIGLYYYDGEGKRIKKVTNSETTVFVYSGGKLIAEYSTATPPPNPTTSYTITDQLGSPRVIVDALGQVVSRRDFLPFGEEVEVDGTYRTTNQKYGQADSVRQRFTGYQKDEETQLDFAEARMYENRHGRFTAVDPLLSSGKSSDPQTFNRYVYVLNNPLIYTDPTGLQVGSWYTTDAPDPGFTYKHPKFLRPDETPAKGYRPMTPTEHVYLNQQRSDNGESDVWSVLNPNRMTQENFESQEQATARLYELAPEMDPNPPSNADSVGYFNGFVGFSIPQAGGLGPAAGAIYDRETGDLMPQIGIIWSWKPGPVFNATYSPLGASDGLYGTAGFGIGPAKVAGSTGVNQNGEPSFEVGASSPGPAAGIFFVYRQQRTAYFENSNSSAQSIESQRKSLGFFRPRNPCFSIRCNSSSNTNSNSNSQ